MFGISWAKQQNKSFYYHILWLLWCETIYNLKPSSDQTFTTRWNHIRALQEKVVAVWTVSAPLRSADGIARNSTCSVTSGWFWNLLNVTCFHSQSVHRGKISCFRSVTNCHSVCVFFFGGGVGERENHLINLQVRTTRAIKLEFTTALTAPRCFSSALPPLSRHSLSLSRSTTRLLRTHLLSSNH